jgi:hypothetical protein
MNMPPSVAAVSLCINHPESGSAAEVRYGSLIFFAQSRKDAKKKLLGGFASLREILSPIV